MQDWQRFWADVAEIGNLAPRKVTHKNAAQPHRYRVLQQWLLYLESNLPVNRGLGSTPNQDLVSALERLPETEVRALVLKFFSARPAYLWLMAPEQGFPMPGNDLSKVLLSIRLLTFQTALSGQGGNLCTFSLNFDEAFLEKAAARSSKADSFTSILNDKMKRELRLVFDDEFGRDNFILPPYWWVLEHAPPDSKGVKKNVPKGIRAFHIHGEIVASNELLPLVKDGLVAASAGYKVKGNRAVKFGEPISYCGPRTWPSKQCLSEFPDAVRADRKNYDTHWPDTYCAKDVEYIEHEARRLNVAIGTPWKVSSPQVTHEAQACLKLLNLLIRYAREPDMPWIRQ